MVMILQGHTLKLLKLQMWPHLVVERNVQNKKFRLKVIDYCGEGGKWAWEGSKIFSLNKTL